MCGISLMFSGNKTVLILTLRPASFAALIPFKTWGRAFRFDIIVKDEVKDFRDVMQAYIDNPDIDVVITSGGTGLTGRDVTPEAIEPLFEKTIDGFSVIFHQVSFQSVGLSTLQSRALAGLANNTFIFCLPGSNGAVKDGWDKVISFQLDSRHKPCNMVELMPRLSET